MESNKSNKGDLKPNKTLFLQIGLIFSLVVMLLLLELMSLFSGDGRFSTKEIEIPVETGMAKEIQQIALKHEQAPPPPPVAMIPSPNLLDVISNNMSIADDRVIDTLAKLKADTLEKKPLRKELETKLEPEVKDSMPLTIVEAKPEFPGGPDALLKFLTAHVKYPPIAKEAGITGTVLVSFLIEKDGSISNIKVINSIGGGCNEEAIRVVTLMPKWTPARRKGKAIRTQFQIPLFFFLRPN